MSENVILAIIAAFQAVITTVAVAYIQSKAKDREDRSTARHEELAAKVEDVKTEVQNLK